MKAQTKVVLSSLAAVALLTLSGCGGGGSSSGGGSTPPPSSSTGNCDAAIDVVLSGNITGQSFTKDKVYGLDGKVRLTVGDLNIQAGTTIVGCSPSSYLIIKPNATITAIGDINEPIIFTSQKDYLGNSSAGQTGEWGGLVLLGNAYADGAPVSYEAGDIDDVFGSTTHANDADNSGNLTYVLIKHTGYEVETDKELNGLSLGGVGSGTTLENIAIVGGSDDGLEAWGGAFNLTGLYVTNAKDDSVDTDLGFTGSFTDVYVKQYIVDKTNNHDSAAIETGNDTDGVNNTTLPVITNFTAEVVGAGIYMKNDAGLNLTNATFRSNKTLDIELVAYRTLDVVNVGTMAASAICFDNAAQADTAATTYAAGNAKDANANTALSDWTTNGSIAGITFDGGCAGIGADIANIWQGTAGSNAPIE